MLPRLIKRVSAITARQAAMAIAPHSGSTKNTTAAELKRIFERWPLVAHEWIALTEQVHAAMQRRLPPDADEVQRLANRWMVLMLEWMEGDMDLMDRWGHMYRHEPSAHSLNHAPSGA